MLTRLKHTDPTHGFVDYQNKQDAKALGLIDVQGTAAYMGVDHSRTFDYTKDVGRPSVRVHSKKTYDAGLFIADIQHMPASVCGTWPAL
jgi:hypothetical protein